MAYQECNGGGARATASALLAERTADLVIICPGSKRLAIGSAAQRGPTVVPHCIAYQQSSELGAPTVTADGAGQTVTGGANTGESSAPTREAAYQQAAQLAGLAVRPAQAQALPPAAGQLGPEQWVCLADQPFSKTQVHTGGEEPSHRPYVVGEEALRIPAGARYQLEWPIVDGRLNVHGGRSRQQVLDDLERVWSWALDRAGLPAARRSGLSAVLVVPATLDSASIKALVDVALCGLRFRAAVVHLEAVAAAFGHGAPAACVVHLGARLSSVVVVEDGSIVPATWRLLPWGGDDVGDTLLWMLQRNGAWPVPGFSPQSRPHDRLVLDHILHTQCFAALEDPGAPPLAAQCEALAPLRLAVRLAGLPPLEQRAALGHAACLAPLAPFLPGLLLTSPARCWLCEAGPAAYDDALEDLGVSIEPTAARLPGTSRLERAASALAMPTTAASDRPALGASVEQQGALALDVAIVQAISQLPKVEQRKRAYQSIVLTGPLCGIKGFADLVEERVLAALPPPDIGVDTVAVLPYSATAIWEGASLLACLDSRESWISGADWCEGGAAVGSASKFARSENIAAKPFWYVYT